MTDPLDGTSLAPPKSLSGDTSGWPTGTPEVADAAKRVGDPQNPLQDLWQNVQGLTDGVGNVAGGYYSLFTDPKAREEWKTGMNQFFNEKGMMGAVGGHLWKGLKQETANHWTNEQGDFDLGYTLWHHPASALMDLAVVKDVAGGGVKMFGQMGGGVSRALATAEDLKLMKPMSIADKVVQAGERLQNIPVDPFHLTGKAVGKVSDKLGISEALGFGPETRNLDAIAAHNEAEVGLEQMRKDALLMAQKYGPDGADRIRGALWRGSNDDFLALKPEEQEFVRNYFESRKVPYDIQEERIKRGFISEAERDDALAKQASLYEYGDVDKAHLAEMKARMKLGAGDPQRVNPSYIYLASEKSHEYSLLENLMREATGAPGKVSFLEGRTGLGDYVKDPLRAALAQNRMEAQFDKKIRLFDRVLDHLQGRGLVKLVENERDIPRGYDIIPNEIWKKYLVNEKRAGGLAFAEATKGFDTATASRQAAEKFLTDPSFFQHVAGNKVVTVPKYVGNWMRYRLGIPGPIARTYDRVMRYWKDQATMLRPAYWANVVGGNGFLSALHGVSPMDAARFWRNRKLLPPELQSIIQTRMGPEGASRYQQVMTNLQSWDSMIHTNFTKGPGFAHEVEAIRQQALETAKALNQAGQKFFIGADTLADPDKFYQLVASSPEQLSKAVQEHVLMREQMVGYSQQLKDLQDTHNFHMSEMDKAQKGYDRVAEKLSEKEREYGGPKRWRELLYEMDQEKQRQQILGKLREEVQGGSTRMLTASEKRFIYGFGGDKTFPKNVLPKEIAAHSEPEGVTLLSPKEPFLVGNRGKNISKRLDKLADDISAAIENSRQQLSAKQAEFARAKKLFFDIQNNPEIGPLKEYLQEATARAQESEHNLLGAKEEYFKNLQKEGMMRSSLPNQQRVADWAEKAIGPVNELEGAYLRLHPFERNYVRRFIPFYPWTKAMTKLVFQLPFTYPKQTFMWNRYAAMMNDLSSSEEHNPEWLRGAVPVAHTADGGTAYIKPFWNPFMGEKPGTLGGVDMPSIVADIAKQNPIFKVMMDLQGGVNQFSMKPFSMGENMTRIDNGEVWKLNGNGKWEKTIAQPSIWKELYSLFPHSQMIDALFLPHQQTDKGFALHPDAIRDAAGNPMYPIPLIQRMTKVLGLPVAYTNPQQELMDKKREMTLYKDYVSRIKRMPPDERATALQVLQDALQVRR